MHTLLGRFGILQRWRVSLFSRAEVGYQPPIEGDDYSDAVTDAQVHRMRQIADEERKTGNWVTHTR